MFVDTVNEHVADWRNIWMIFQCRHHRDNTSPSDTHGLRQSQAHISRNILALPHVTVQIQNTIC